MKEVSKFIPMDGNPENFGEADNGANAGESSSFRVCGSSETNLPTKPSAWSKLKGLLTTEITVELTPYEQKVEKEINDFLHQEVTWQSFKNFLLKDVEITF